MPAYPHRESRHRDRGAHDLPLRAHQGLQLPRRGCRRGRDSGRRPARMRFEDVGKGLLGGVSPLAYAAATAAFNDRSDWLRRTERISRGQRGDLRRGGGVYRRRCDDPRGGHVPGLARRARAWICRTRPRGSRRSAWAYPTAWSSADPASCASTWAVRARCWTRESSGCDARSRRPDQAGGSGLRDSIGDGSRIDRYIGLGCRGTGTTSPTSRRSLRRVQVLSMSASRQAACFIQRSRSCATGREPSP